MSRYKTILLPLILLFALLAACTAANTEPGTADPEATPAPEVLEPAMETPAAEGDADAITAAAIVTLANELGLTGAEIEVVSAEMTEFTDSCLGLGGAAESCLQAITPGWIVMLSANGQEYEVHTDATGTQVRVAGDAAVGNEEADRISAAVQEFLAAQLGVSLGDVQVVSVEMTEYSDGCLGLGQANESCLQAITPGWFVILDVNGQTYEVRTDATGEQIRVDGDMMGGDEAPGAVAAAVQEYLAGELGVALGDVQVLSTEATQFSDGCLGLGRPDESCIQVITPGWVVMVSVNGQEYEVHTDETGQQVRVAGDIP